MKNKIILASVTFVIIVSGFAAYQYFSSFRTVTFNLKEPDVKVEIYRSNNDDRKLVKTVDQSGEISLQQGKYLYITRGEKVAPTPSVFEVKESGEVITIDPDYSKEYLAKMLDSEKDKIHFVIRSTYPEIIDNYTILDGELLKKGNWYGTIIHIKKDDPRQIIDPYRIVMKKDKTTWKIIRYPEIVVTSTNYPDVPEDVLRAINKLLET